MLKNIDLFYFSPTGGTKTYGTCFSKHIANNINLIDLGKNDLVSSSETSLSVFALPVFGGRIPKICAEKIKTLSVTNKKAVTIVVYGTRAYEDALLELNNIVESSGYNIIASAAVVSKHSIVPEVGKNRPDDNDINSIEEFAEKVLEKIENNNIKKITVPGNYPYKEAMKSVISPISLPNCSACGHCISYCPTNAISITNNIIETDISKCILCMACTVNCPNNARILPENIQKNMADKLSSFVSVYRENEYFL